MIDGTITAEQWGTEFVDRSEPRAVFGRFIPAPQGDLCRSYWQEGLAVDRPRPVRALIFDGVLA